jgi:hypothetical protein
LLIVGISFTEVILRQAVQLLHMPGGNKQYTLTYDSARKRRVGKRFASKASSRVHLLAQRRLLTPSLALVNAQNVKLIAPAYATTHQTPLLVLYNVLISDILRVRQ